MGMKPEREIPGTLCPHVEARKKFHGNVLAGKDYRVSYLPDRYLEKDDLYLGTYCNLMYMLVVSLLDLPKNRYT